MGPAAAERGTHMIRGLLIAIALFFVGALLFAPLAMVFASALEHGAAAWFNSFTDSDTGAAIRLTLLTAAIVVPLNTLFGICAAWCIAKFEFPGKSVLVTLIDLPLAVSPVVSGLVYVLLFGLQGWFGAWLQEHEISIIFALPGIVLATMFVTFPYVARELIPLMQQMGNDEEEAAITLGAGGWFTFFHVTLPRIRWGLLYGVILCNARAMGEFGAVFGGIRPYPRADQHHAPAHRNPLSGIQLHRRLRRGLAAVVAGSGHPDHQDDARMADWNSSPLKLLRNRLGWWLAATQVLLVLVVAAGMAWAAIDLLQDLADSQQRVHVQLAGADARAALNRASEDTLSHARALAERPTLRRLLEERDLSNLSPSLARFCDTAGMDACAVLQDGKVLATAGAAAPWPALRVAATEQGERFMAAPQGLGACLARRHCHYPQKHPPARRPACR